MEMRTVIGENEIDKRRTYHTILPFISDNNLQFIEDNFTKTDICKNYTIKFLQNKFKDTFYCSERKILQDIKRMTDSTTLLINVMALQSGHDQNSEIYNSIKTKFFKLGFVPVKCYNDEKNEYVEILVYDQNYAGKNFIKSIHEGTIKEEPIDIKDENNKVDVLEKEIKDTCNKLGDLIIQLIKEKTDKNN